MRLDELLEKLVMAPSITGFETEARKVIIEELKSLGIEVEVDIIGNVIGKVKRKDKPKIMLVAHMDQIGIMVTYIDEKGYIHFTARGYDPRILYGQRVVLYTKKGAIYGVIATKPPHLLKPEERNKVVTIDDMVIDIGANNKEEVEELGIRSGVVGTISPIYRKLVNDRVLGIGLDDKAGVASIVGTLAYLNIEEIENVSIYLVASTQEEVGARGARISAYNIAPDIAIAVDVTFAVSPGIEPKQVSGIELGKGVAIGIGPNFHPKLVDLMIRICKEKKIPFQIEPILGPSGTDAWVIQVTRGGVITGLASIPLRYMHSAGEVLSLRDVESVAKLLAELILELDTMKDWKEFFKF